MKKLLYINNYNCRCEHKEGYPDNHLWGADALAKKYDVTCAKVPKSLLPFQFKGSAIINSWCSSLIMLCRYFNYSIVYAACSDMTKAFALANVLHLGHRRLYMIQHHGGGVIAFPHGYSKIMFISPFVASLYDVGNKMNVNWGGQIGFAAHVAQKINHIQYDFVSAGEASRDHICMIFAAEHIEGKTLIISTLHYSLYDKTRITILSTNNNRYSTSYYDTYENYAKSKFIVIPIIQRSGKAVKSLAGLTSFVDAVVMHKPVLISDSSNMGIDVEGLGIGLVYKAGDAEDMRAKMQQMLAYTDEEYRQACCNMEEYSKTHNYDEFCKEILAIVK